ncbi:MAG: hypothetical protein IMF06_10720 [Proteobacteria bacterium]|nr:hypothetical protein [Pseudomonadota bacterium]
MRILNIPSLTRGLFACFVLQSQLAIAHLPEHYGREYIRYEGVREGDIAEPDASELTSPSAEDQSAYEKQMDGAEMSGGPYSSGLTDPLLGMGHYHRKRGSVDDALETYKRALHLVRINDGLYSEQQLPILREIMDIYRLLGDYQSLDETYQYYYRLRNIDKMPHTQEWLDTGLEYFTWERQLYASRSVANKRAPLMRAYRANENMLESLKPSTEEELVWHFHLCLSQMRNLYLIMGGEPISVSASLVSGEGPAVDAVNREYAFVQETALHKGQNLLEGCIEYAQASPPTELAALHLELGDWLQWNDKLRRAGEQYLQVVELLRAAGEERLLGQWLDQPVELPDESDLWSVGAHAAGSGRAVVEANYDVTSRGDVLRIKVSVSDEEREWQAWRIKRLLRDTHFRPRFSQGVPESVEALSRRYMLVDGH